MKHIQTFESFLNEQLNEGSRYSIYKKEIEWKQHPKKSGSYVAKSGKSELEILSTGYGNWELKVDGTIVMPSETAKEKSAKDNHTNTFNWANDKVGTLKHTAQEMFESQINEYRDEEAEAERKAKNLLPLDIGTYKHGVPQVVKLLGPLYKYYKSYLDRSPSDSETRFELLAKYKEKSFPNAQIAWDIVETKGKFEL